MLVTANVFQPLIDVFETVLKFFHDTGGIPWGWSIVLLTIAVRAVLVPLTFRQIKSMVRMQTLAPQMKEIQAKYKQDKQRQQQEMMKFYQANGVNPLGSCLPMVLQLPVFISLYYMLRKSLRGDICPMIQTAHQKAYAAAHHVSLAAAKGQTTACGSHAAGAHFLFISDLTAKATGIELGVLIVLYIASQLGSTLVMSAATMDPTQRKIMMFMPLIFVLFVIRFPAGLLLYWITTNLWTVAQQYIVRRRIGPARAAAVAATAEAGAGGNGGPSSSLTGTSGAGGGSPGDERGGGVGGWLTRRVTAAQENAEATRAQRSSGQTQRANGNGGGNGNGNGGGGGGRGKAGATAGSRGSRSGTSGGSAAGPSSLADRARGALRPGGSGSGGSGGNGADPKGGKRAGGSTAKAAPKSKSSGSGSSAGPNGSSNGGGATPPRPPRKKKKRSGRRR